MLSIVDVSGTIATGICIGLLGLYISSSSFLYDSGSCTVGPTVLQKYSISDCTLLASFSAGSALAVIFTVAVVLETSFKFAFILSAVLATSFSAC